MRLIVIFWLLAAPLAFAQDVGRVHFIQGESDVERGGTRTALQVFSQVRQGDVIRTGADGHVQLVMVDGARIALRPKSEMKLERYEFSTQSQSAGQALLSLLTGTMRVFTGEIVNRDKDSFRMKTNLANVGIRGSGNILANLEGGATFNHTLTGAHTVTSRDSLGQERTVISYPGQTVQVLPGQAPRHVPTPALIMAAASPPAQRSSSDKAVDTSAAATSGGGAASGGASSSSSSTTSSSSGTGGGTTASSGGEATPTTSGSTATTTTTASTAPATTVDPTPVTTSTSSGSPTSATSPTSTLSGTSPISSPAPTTSTSQATTGAVGGAIIVAQPPAEGYQSVLRFFNPISSGYEGVIADSSTVVIDASGRLVQARNATLTTFLAGPGALPSGYSDTVSTGDITFANGTHRDAFRSGDGSVILGRWEGGTLDISGRTFDLGSRSVSYDVTTPTPVGTVGSFTGSATYSLAASTAPTDSAGRTGTVSSAQVSANFTSRTVSGLFAITINGQNFSLSGNASLDPGSSNFAFASSLNNLAIGCTGSCSSAGYLGTMNGQFAGSAGRWLSMSYRLNPNRGSGSGWSDFIVGNIALDAGANPTIGVVLPQTGSVSLVFNGVDAQRSFSTYAGATGTPTVTGTLQANFSNQTASFNATLSGSGSPTLTASASNMPIAGAGFSGSNVNVTCSGTGCGSSPSGRFDGLFRNSAGTSGVASIVVGDSNGAFDVLTSFGTSAASAMLASDARALARAVPALAMPGALAHAQLQRSFARPGRVP